MAREEAEIKELSKKLAQNPDSMVFVQLADAHRRLGDLDQSVEVCLQGLERHPTYTTARVILGRNYLDLAKLDEAETEFRKIEVADPENIVAHRMLGQIYMAKGMYSDAIIRHQKVLGLDPDDAAAQEQLQEALTKAKQQDQSQAAAAAAAPMPETQAAPATGSSEHIGTIKVAEIYIKKGAFDEAMEVLQEVLAADPGNALAKQKLKEIEEKRGPASDDGAGKRKADEDAKRKADEDAKRKADEDAKRKADEDAKRKADEDAKRKADEDAKRKADEDAKRKADEDAKRKADEDAKRKADEDAKRKADEDAKRKADEDAKRKADEDAKRKADEDAKRKADEDAKRKADEDAKRKADEDAKRKADEEIQQRQEAERRRAAQDEKERKAAKLSSDDILSAMGDGAELVGEEAEPAPVVPRAAAAPAAEVPAQASGLDAGAKTAIDEFLRAQGMEASLVLSHQGAVIESHGGKDAQALGTVCSQIFSNTQKAAGRMHLGNLKQIMVSGEDGRQILFVQLKACVLVALTGKSTNLGLLRVAVNDLAKKA